MDEDSLQRIAALEKRVAELERQLAAAKASGQRALVQQALMDDRLLILERNRLFRLWSSLYRGAARLYSRLGSGTRYGGLSDLRTPGDYALWVQREQQEALPRNPADAPGPLISVLLAVPAGAAESPCRISLQSLSAQSYPHWELCVACQDQAPGWIGSATSAVSAMRILEHCATPLVNAAAQAATGEYLLLLHAGDRLSPQALHHYAQAHRLHPSSTILYSDEDHLDAAGNRTDPLFKPGWSPELLRSTPYLGRSIVYRRDLFLETLVREDKDAALWDQALRISRKDPGVWHVPRVLYHRSTHESLQQPSSLPDTAPPGTKLSLIVCSRQVRRVRECLSAVQATATLPIEILVVHHLESGDGGEMRRYVEQVSGTWIPYRGPFDFASMNNLAASRATAPHLLFMNDDVVVHQPGWDQALAAALSRPGIGVAGAILQYPNGSVQHAGVVVGMGDAAGHCGRFQRESKLWPWLSMTRDVSAVTGAMLAIGAEQFRQMGGFDTAFPINYNDVDLCLRVRQAGLRVVCLNLGKVVHRESQTRIGGTRHQEREALYQRWPEALSHPDEFYSMHLAPTERIALNLKGTNHPLQELAT